MRLNTPNSHVSQELRRSLHLLQGFRTQYEDPDGFYTLLADDTVALVDPYQRVAGKRVIDIGGGRGYFAQAFRRAGAESAFVEPFWDEFTEEGKKLGYGVIGDGMQLPFADKTFDVSHSSNVLEHVTDPKRFIDEMIRVVHPRGVIFLAFTNWFSPFGGHETSPWHYLGGERAAVRYEHKTGQPPKNRYGSSLFRLDIAEVQSWVKARTDVDLIDAFALLPALDQATGRNTLGPRGRDLEPGARHEAPMSVDAGITHDLGHEVAVPPPDESEAETGGSETGEVEIPLESDLIFDHSKPLSRWTLAAISAGFLGICFAQAPGLIEDDTKLPMLLTPFQYIATSFHAWNPNVYGGTVGFDTGLLMPMGFFFGLTHLLGIPVWCAERIWLAGLLTIACWGVVRLSESLGIGTRASRVFAGLAFCASPIMVTRVTNTAALLAIVFLPWMLRPLVVGSRNGSTRRAAARSGVAVALMGGANAAVVLAVLPLGAIWLLTRKPGPRRRSLTLWWFVALGLACFWWAVSYALVGKYGFNYLPFTETSAATTGTSSLFEALRGASYWIDYFNVHGPLIPGVWLMVSSAAIILAGAFLIALGLLGLCRRIPEKLFLVGSLAFGVAAISAGYAGADGGFFSMSVQHVLQGVLAPFRNIAKFTPDVSLPLALGMAWSLSLPRWGGIRYRPTRKVRGWLTVVLAVWVVAISALAISAAPFWRGQLYKPGGFASVPKYWDQAGSWLDTHQGRTNALLVPGAAFADYTWGDPVDEPLQIVSNTSAMWRNIIPVSSNGNIQALDAVESVIDGGTAQAGLAQFLSTQGVKYVVERNDLDLPAVGGPPPAQVHQVLSETPGLTEVASFGRFVSPAQASYGSLPVFDSPADLRLRPVEIFRVDVPTSIVMTYPARNPLVVSGDVGSLLSLSATGLSQGRATVLNGDSSAQGALSAANSTWAITDGNKRVEVSFGGIRDNQSYVLSADQTPPGKTYGVPSSFAVVTDQSHETVSAPIGAASVTASSFGSSSLVDDPGAGPMAAFDGNSTTAWVAHAANDSVGQWVSITFRHRLPMSSIDVTPLVGSAQQPTVSRIIITTDRGSVTRYLPPRSSPVRVSVPKGESLHLKVTIAAVRPVPPVSTGGIVLGAGITNIAIPGLKVVPQLKVPNDEPSQFKGEHRNDLVVNFSRPLANANLKLGSNDASLDPNMAREFTLPAKLVTSVSGTALPKAGPKLSAMLQFLAPVPKNGLTVSASSWLGSLPRFRPQNLVDGSTTPWIADKNDKNPTLKLTWNTPTTVHAIALLPTLYASRPTEIEVSGGAGAPQLLHVPASGGVLTFAPFVTKTLRIRIVAATREVTLSPESGVETPLPVGIAGIGVPGVITAPYPPLNLNTPVRLPCGLGPSMDIDGRSVATSVSGTLGDLIDLKPVGVSACLPFGAFVLNSGTNEFQANDRSSPFDVASVTMKPLTASTGPTSVHRIATIEQWHADSRSIRVSAGPATDLVVAQNYSDGWVAKLGSTTLKPLRIDGWEQGYVVPAGTAGTVTLDMAPDSAFRSFLLVGGILLVLLLVLALLPEKRTREGDDGPRTLPSRLLLLVAAVVLFVIAGPLALVVVPLFMIGRRWGARVLAVVAFICFCVAGAAAAWNPAVLERGTYSAGAFGRPAQIASVIALAALLCTVVLEGSFRDRGLGRDPLGGTEDPSPADSLSSDAGARDRGAQDDVIPGSEQTDTVERISRAVQGAGQPGIKI